MGVWLVSEFGLLGFFIAAFFSNTIIPIPFEVLLLAVSTQTGSLPLWVIVGALGATLGESTMYLLGRGGHKFADRYYDSLHRLMNKARCCLSIKRRRKRDLRHIAKHKSAKSTRDLLRKYGWFAIFVGAFTPLPMFLFDIVAGYYGYEYRMFASACFAGKACRYMVIIYTGTALKDIFF